MTDPIGRRRWVIAASYLRGWSPSPESGMASHEMACILNGSNR